MLVSNKEHAPVIGIGEVIMITRPMNKRYLPNVCSFPSILHFANVVLITMSRKLNLKNCNSHNSFSTYLF